MTHNAANISSRAGLQSLPEQGRLVCNNCRRLEFRRDRVEELLYSHETFLKFQLLDIGAAYAKLVHSDDLKALDRATFRRFLQTSK